MIKEAIQKRKTFAIISHPDAGKTTLTEKLLLFGGAIHLAGSVKAKKSSRHATSDWMELEKQRGISVTTSVMQFNYRDTIVNLLDTPGHADFSEDTYRTLTAVDSALMVIDAAKGVEDRTVKLLEVCRLRHTPVMTFINKFDRDSRDPISLIDEIEEVLKIQCTPITWPIGMGQHFLGIYHVLEDRIYIYNKSQSDDEPDQIIEGLQSDQAKSALGEQYQSFYDEVELLTTVAEPFDRDAFLRGEQTPVFAGSAMNNFGVEPLLKAFVEYAPVPAAREAAQRVVEPEEEKFSAFVFKIQANMDPQHHDRIAFARICSGSYRPGMRFYHVKEKKTVSINQVMTFMAKSRDQVQEAYAGDIIGLHNHGTIQIGDSFTEGETLQFLGVPHFAPELFRRVILADPLKAKALQKGLNQLAEEGAVQVFKPLLGSDLLIGAIGALQFDVVAYRLQHEYKVQCRYEQAPIRLVRWLSSDNNNELTAFKEKYQVNCALDAGGYLAYLASSAVNLSLMAERFPTITFNKTREHC